MTTVAVNRQFDSKGKRTDEHRPEVFDPADYTVLGYWDNKPPQFFGGWMAAHNVAAYNNMLEFHAMQVRAHRTQGERYFPEGQNFHVCAHCGHQGIRYVCVVRHVPSGKNLAFGDICAERVQLENRSEFEARKVRGEAKARRDREVAEQAKAEWMENNPQVAQYIAQVAAAEVNDAEGWRDYYGSFVVDVYRRFNQYGSMSEKQAAAFMRSVAGAAKRAEQQAQWAAEKEAAADAPEGKHTVEGVVVSDKWQPSDFGDQHKMTVKLDDGSAVYVTVPKAIEAAYQSDPDARLKGQRVKFTATFTRSDKDSKFSFGKRPTQASVVGEVKTSPSKPAEWKGVR